LVNRTTEGAIAAVSRYPLDRERPSLPYSCRCGTRWGGERTCHCPSDGCHETFSTVDNFDGHRRGGACLDPAEVHERDGTPRFKLSGWRPGVWVGYGEREGAGVGLGGDHG
jgi:hypothetical protein